MDHGSEANGCSRMYPHRRGLAVTEAHNDVREGRKREVSESGDRRILIKRSRTHLLEEQLRRIRDRELRHFLGGLAVRAPAVVPEQTALLAGVDLKLVRGDHESLEEQLCCTVADETVAFHLSET